MRILALATFGVAALSAGAAFAQTTPQPTGTPSVSAPQTPTTASPEAPSFNKIGPLGLSYNIGVSSDYRFRGVSQTKEQAQIYGGIDATLGNFYAGVWASNLNFKPFGDRDTSHEIDVYGGYKPTIATVSFDVGVIYYGYANQPSYLPDVDYIEGYIKGTKAFGPVTVGGSFYYSPEFTGKTGEAEYYEGNLAWAVNKKLSLSGAVGRQEIQKAAAFTTWNLGATYAITDHLSADLRYWDTDEHGFGKVYGDTIVGGLKVTF